MLLYQLSHFLQIWIFPPGFNLLIALIGILLLRPLKRLAFCLLFFSFISLWIVSTPLIAELFLEGLLHQYPALQLSPNKVDKQPGAGAILVLGGGAWEASEYKSGYATSRNTLNRLRYAVYLYQQTQLPIIVSGGKTQYLPYAEAELMSTDLKEYFNIPVVWKESKSFTTRDEAKFLLPILQQHKINKIYLVTDAEHMLRAMYAFKSALVNTDINIIAAPVGCRKLDTEVHWLDFFPSAGGLYTFVGAMHEYIGLLAYHFANWL